MTSVMRYFAFTVLVFGLASAPFTFTKVLKALIKHWREFREGGGGPILIWIPKEFQLLLKVI